MSRYDSELFAGQSYAFQASDLHAIADIYLRMQYGEGGRPRLDVKEDIKDPKGWYYGKLQANEKLFVMSVSVSASFLCPAQKLEHRASRLKHGACLIFVDAFRLDSRDLCSASQVLPTYKS